MKEIKKHNLKTDIFICLISTCMCLSALELYFRFFFIQSDGVGITYAHKKWIEKYWKPINSYGFRDVEWLPSDLSGKKVIIVVGDSFTAGHGIKNISDTFSGVLASKLGSNYSVVNISLCGLNTVGELVTLYKYHQNADIVIWSYLPNDIEGTSKQFERFDYKIKYPKGFLKYFVDNSSFFNFVWWRLIRLGTFKRNESYSIWLKAQFNDPEIWNLHQSALKLFIRLCNEIHAKPIVVLFPFLNGVEESKIYLGKVGKVFEDLNIPMLNVLDLISGMEVKDLVVNGVDLHPNERLHKLVGEKLYGLVLQQDYKEDKIQG